MKTKRFGFAILCACMGGAVLQAAPAEWSPAGNMFQARKAHAAVLLADKGEGRNVLIAGGETGMMTDSPNLYKPASEVWVMGGTLPVIIAFPYATLLQDGSVILMGASQSVFQYATTAAGSSWQEVNSNAPERQAAAYEQLTDGTILLCGGKTSGNGDTTVSSAQIYNPTAKVWVAAPSMKAPRRYHTATLLLDGRVLVVGGGSTDANITSVTAEIFDPKSTPKKWTLVKSMSVARSKHCAVRLGDGRVLVVGGGSSLAEIYNPADDSWTPAGNLVGDRDSMTATLLTDGRVLVVGGKGNGTLATAELYDPVTNSWTATASMNLARRSHTATLLTDGRVLVAGGSDGSNSLSSAEIYTPEIAAVTPTPTATPTTPTTPGGSVAQPVVAITGKKKITTTKGSVRVKGTATGAVTTVLVKAGKKTVRAAGTTSWSARVKVKPGVNRITVTATGPGGTSAPAKMTIVRR